MAEDVFRPRKITAEDIDAHESGNSADNIPEQPGLQIQGKMPQKFKDALREQRQERQETKAITNNASPGFSALLDALRDKDYEPVQLPSLGKFYDGADGPTDGMLHIRTMTGEEEQILATPRFAKKGQAINMIFQRCMKENFRAEELLTIDRTYLLIYLRGISYTPAYEVELKCPNPGCEKRFSTVIDLDTLTLEDCPSDFVPPLEDVLPKSGLKFSYRLSKGKDENELQEYRDRRLKMFGEAAADDTLTYRAAMLVNKIADVTDKKELQMIIKHLPIQDVSYIRNCINEPPFGVDTNVEIMCANCMYEFTIELPLEANFFFPRRKKKEKTQA